MTEDTTNRPSLPRDEPPSGPSAFPPYRAASPTVGSDALPDPALTNGPRPDTPAAPPTDDAPADAAPADGTPADATPADATPADAARADATPANATPADATPAGPTVTDPSLSDARLTAAPSTDMHDDAGGQPTGTGDEPSVSPLVEPVGPAPTPEPVPPLPVPDPDPLPVPDPLPTPDPGPAPAPPPVPHPDVPAPSVSTAPDSPAPSSAANPDVGARSSGDGHPTASSASAVADVTPLSTEGDAQAAPALVRPPVPGAAQGNGRGPGRPGGRPGGGRPGGRPRPVPSATASAAVIEPIVEPVDPRLWGRIDGEGVVYVRTSVGERVIGNWQAGDNEAGLAHFGRRFDDFATEIALLEARLVSGSADPKGTKQQAITLRDSIDTIAAIGDLDGAAARLETVITAADAAIAGASQARNAARAAAIAKKEALCAEAEGFADSTQWKATGDRLKSIVEEWRTIRGIDRKTDDALWKRFAKARDAFTRHRGSHFAELDKQRGAAKDAKEALIARAEALSEATDWGETAGAYRELMNDWKAAGRAPRDVEDALWARFRAAQERFFSRRNKTFSERDAEFDANAATKEQLLAEAERIDPAKDLDAARAALRSVQERWEAAGKVPRERIRELDGRLRAVEDRVRNAEERHWRRTDPETTARLEQFQARVESYRAQAAKARAAGDERKAVDAERQAAQWEEWLSAAQGAVDS